jgi:hypothetical protein
MGRLLYVVLDESNTFIALMMEVVSTSETSVHFNVTTRLYVPEDPKFKFS